MTNTRKLVIAVGALLALYLVLGKAVELYTEWLWFVQLHFGQVFVRILTARLLLFLLVTAIVFVVVFPQCLLARRFSRDLPVPVLTRLIPLDDKLTLDRYVDRYLLWGILVFSVIGGVMGSGAWYTMLRFTHAVPFGGTDPIFGKEISFYIFRMPFWQLLWQTVFAAAILGVVGSALIYIYDDIIQLATERVYIAPRALGRLSVGLALVYLLKAVGYQFNAWKLLYSTRGVTHGVGYVDAHVYLPSYRLLMIAAAAVAGVLVWNYFQQSFKLAAGAVGVQLALSGLLLGVVPGLVQKLIVTPNELEKEAPYIRNNIRMTRDAYGLSKIRTVPHPGRAALKDNADLVKNDLTLRNIRIWDDRPLQQTYQQLQGIRPYYRFADVDVDRYTIDGAYRQVMLSARELSHERVPRRTWVNDHLMYTHGYGLCLNPVNYATKEGQPDFLIKDLPPVSATDLKLRQPALYYGEDPDAAALRREREEEARARAAQEAEGVRAPAPTPQKPPPELAGEEARSRDNQEEGEQTESPIPPLAKLLRHPVPRGGIQPEQQLQTWLDYVIVHSSIKEFDYPKGGQKNVYTRYAGRGGVPVNTFLRKLAFGWRFSNLKIPLSGYIKKGTRILYHRRIMDRCRTIAPFLRYDRDPYVVIADGKVYWIIDAYTVTDMYPYSERTRGFGNYVRNPVKVVIDAYNGDVKFYVIDETEPIIRCYAKIFPKLFTPGSEMPKSLRAHLRYPMGMFMIQALLYSTYHMDRTEVFYNKEDQWEMPSEVYGEGIHQRMDAYYMVTKPPGKKRESFYLFLPMTPANKDNIIAWMCANCDDPHYGELTVYNFPKDKVVYGPMQIEARIDQDEHISKDFTLWSQKGSRVIRGNLLVIPIEDSLLYVEPIYLQAERSELPELKRVIVVNGNDIAMEPTLEGALEKLFPGLAAARRAGKVAAPSSPAQPSGPKQAARPLPPAGPPLTKDQRQELIQRADMLYSEAMTAGQRGDWAAYGDKLKQLGKVLKRLKQITISTPKKPAERTPSQGRSR